MVKICLGPTSEHCHLSCSQFSEVACYLEVPLSHPGIRQPTKTPPDNSHITPDNNNNDNNDTNDDHDTDEGEQELEIPFSDEENDVSDDEDEEGVTFEELVNQRCRQFAQTLSRTYGVGVRFTIFPNNMEIVGIRWSRGPRNT